MKRYLFILLSITLIGLLACGEEREHETSNNDEPEIEEVEKDEPKEDPEKPEEKEDDGLLTKVGQKSKANGMTAELISIKEVNETVDLDPIKLTVDDIKVIRISDIKDKDARNYLGFYTDKDEFDTIQIMYSIENTSDEKIEFYTPIEYLVLNTGEQLDVSFNDYIGDINNGGEFYGKVTKNTGISVIMHDSKAEDIESIKLIFGNVWGENDVVYQKDVEKTYDIK